jgi:hypothetical protein
LAQDFLVLLAMDFFALAFLCRAVTLDSSPSLLEDEESEERGDRNHV